MDEIHNNIEVIENGGVPESVVGHAVFDVSEDALHTLIATRHMGEEYFAGFFCLVAEFGDLSLRIQGVSVDFYRGYVIAVPTVIQEDLEAPWVTREVRLAREFIDIRAAKETRNALQRAHKKDES